RIAGLDADPAPAGAGTGEAAWPGTNASRTAARAAAKSAGRPISHVVRLTDMGAPFPGGASPRRPSGPTGRNRLCAVSSPSEARSLPSPGAGPHTGKPTTTGRVRLPRGHKVPGISAITLPAFGLHGKGPSTRCNTGARPVD